MNEADKIKQADDFIRRYQAMRKAQKAYFRYRHPEHLKKCKEMEKEVDRMAEEWWVIDEPKLF